MSQKWNFCLGLLSVGALCVGAVLAQGGVSKPGVEKFTMQASDVVAVTHDGKKPLLPAPQGIALFSEPNISSGFVLLTKLRNQNGEIVGYAVESEVVAPESNIAQGILKTLTQWTLVIPGRGTLFLDEIEDSSDLGKQILPVILAGGVWDKPVDFVSTAGPSPEGKGVVIGGTGEFSGRSGQFIEITHLHQWSLKGGLDAGIELEISYR